MNDFKITIARFGPYPADEPVSYVVGFTVTHAPTGRSMYRDCTVPFTDLASAHTDDDVIAAAWNGLKEYVEVWCGACGAKSHVIGSTFVPLTDPSIDPSIDPSVDPIIEPSANPSTDLSIEPSIEPVS